MQVHFFSNSDTQMIYAATPKLCKSIRRRSLTNWDWHFESRRTQEARASWLCVVKEESTYLKFRSLFEEPIGGLSSPLVVCQSSDRYHYVLLILASSEK